MSTKQILTRFIVGIAFLLAVTAAAEAQSPSGSVAFETADASAMGDTQWVGCTLTVNGKIYGCTVTGLSAPLTGTARVSGMVFDLKDPKSFAGTYTAAGSDLSLEDGHLALKNQSGVKMVLTAFGDLVELRAADKGVIVTLKEERKKAR
jgi:hypothetical protein